MFHQVVNQPRDGFARGADHVGDGLVRWAGDGDVAVVEGLSLLFREVDKEAGQAAVDVHRGQRLDAVRGVAQAAA